MNLGYGLAAVDSYFKAGDERKVREYEQAKRDAELSLMDDKVNADRNRLRLESAQSSAGLETLPGQTANTMAKQRYEQADLTAKADRQGLDNAAAMSKSKVAAETARFDENNLASTLDSMAVKNELSKQEQLDAVLGNLAKTFNANDKPRALAFANRIASASNILPEFNGKTATDITVENGADKLNTGPGYRIKFSDGTDLFLAQQTMNDALTRVKGNSKLHFMHDKDTGEVLVGNESTGKVTVARQPDLSRVTNNVNKMGPLERDVNYLVTGHGMSKEQALAHLQSAKTMSRENFILKAVENAQAMGKKVTDADIAEFGSMYDRAGQAQQKSPNVGAPAQAPNPKIQRLISGAPSGPSLSHAPTVAQPASAPQPQPAKPAAAPTVDQRPTAALAVPLTSDEGASYRQQLEKRGQQSAKLALFERDPRVSELRKKEEALRYQSKPAQANAVLAEINKIREEYLR